MKNPFGTRRSIAAAAFCAPFSALWIASGSLPGSETTPMLVTVGLVLPAGVATLTLTLMEQRNARDLRPAPRRDLPVQDRATVTTGGVRPQRPVSR